MILEGTPNRQIQCSKNKLAHSKAVMVVWQGMNLTTRENLSTIVNTASYPRTEVGNYIIKSIVTCSNGLLGFSTAYSNPGGRWVECLLA